jgi:hypothetical protein
MDNPWTRPHFFIVPTLIEKMSPSIMIRYAVSGTDEAIPCILEPEENKKASSKNRAGLIQKIYEVDPC